MNNELDVWCLCGRQQQNIVVGTVLTIIISIILISDLNKFRGTLQPNNVFRLEISRSPTLKSTGLHYATANNTIPIDSNFRERRYHHWNNSHFSSEAVLLPCNVSAFLAPNVSASFVDTSQGQLVILRPLFESFPNGECFFVDLATNHWHDGSNTWPLETFLPNWSGICIEPNPKYHRGILENRKCVLVTNPVASENKKVPFIFDDGLGGIFDENYDGKNKVAALAVTLETATLNQILERFAPAALSVKPFGYLSLDVEGGEYEVMRAFDFERYKFLVMTVERPKDVLHHLLVKNGYWWLAQAGGRTLFGEMIYIHSSLSNFAAIMSNHRKNEITSYTHNYKMHNCLWLLRPVWPPTNSSLPREEIFQDGDLIKCGIDRQIWIFQGGAMRGIQSLAAFTKLGRDFSEVIQLSPELCAVFRKGDDLH